MSEEEKYEDTVEIHTLLGRGSHFEGKLTFEGTVRIDGEFKGQIFTDDILVIGEGGHVAAELEIGSLVVEGMVEGNIVAKRSVEIHSPGRVKGSITTPSLFIDRGVVFEGTCQMTDDTYVDDEQKEDQVITADLPESSADAKGIGNITKSGIIGSSSGD
jgi:cytoskeletal protein CcmA (bactofilin family)